MPYDVSIIIVNYSQPELTNESLESVMELEQSGHSLHVIVVDNGSAEEYQLPKRFAKLGITILRSAANLGFTGGNNMGIHAAIEKYNSEFVLLLNNDAMIASNALTELLTFSDAHPQYGIISPKIYFYPGDETYKKDYLRSQKGKVLWYAGGCIDWRNLDNFHKGVDEVDRGQFDQQSETEFSTGCALLIRREVLEKVGLLEKKYFLYYEDADWSMLAKRYGYQIGFCSKAWVWHRNAGSSNGSGSLMHQYYQTRNRLLFFWYHGNWRTRMTVARLGLRLILGGTKVQRVAVRDSIFQRFGKQQIA